MKLISSQEVCAIFFKSTSWGKATARCHWGSWHLFFFTIFPQHKTAFSHVNNHCCVPPFPPAKITQHYLPISSKNTKLFFPNDIIELAHWNWITDSLVFSAPRYDVISWLFLRYLFALSLSSSRAAAAVFAVFFAALCGDKRNQPMTYCACFSSVTGLEVNSFLNAASFKKSSAGNRKSDSLSKPCVCGIADEQIQGKMY